MTLRVLSRHAPAGQTLLQIAPLGWFSYSAFRTYGTCPLQYAFQRVYRIPGDETKSYLEFGTAVHSAFETFAIARRDARAGKASEPGIELLKSEFDKVWQPTHDDDAQQAEHYLARSEPALRRFYDRELASASTAIAFEQGFEFVLDAGEDAEPVRVRGVIDRIDRLPDGSIEVIDYKTGRWKSQGEVDADEQLTTYALALSLGAVRDPVGGDALPPASKLTLYFTESDRALSTTRSAEQLDAFGAKLVETARRIRGGDFTATPGFKTCDWCDYRRICPNRWGEQ
jgi:RecB family exonuclease